jgi:shikimate dehydrogenase
MEQLPLASPELWDDCEVLVNATPVGMYPDWQSSPVDISFLPNLRGVLDCIYNPLRTRLVLDALERGIPAEGGLYMLVGQAVRARELFDGVSIPDSVCEDIYGRILKSKRNLVLTGMPSSGKSTVGLRLAALTGRRFMDTDDVISLQAGMDIPTIFAREGEAGFRKRETAAIESIAAEQGLIIATGGGAIMNDGNVRLLRHNGIICLLQRDLDLLVATDDRPLSRDRAALQALYERRLPCYLKAAELTIDNNGPMERTIDQLIELC